MSFEEPLSSLDMRVAGPLAWRKIDDAIEELPCASCRDRGFMLVHGSHDVENLHLGKPVFDPENFKVFVAEVNEAAGKAGIVTGREVINSRPVDAVSEKKLADPMETFVPPYAGNFLGYGIDKGLDMLETSVPSPVPGVRTSTLGHVIGALGFFGLGYFTRRRQPLLSNLSYVTSAFLTTQAVDSLITAPMVAAVRQAPFVPVQLPAPVGGAALF